MEINKISKSRFGKAKKIEFEFRGLEINNIGKSRCEEGNAVTWAQRSGPLKLVYHTKYIFPNTLDFSMQEPSELCLAHFQFPTCTGIGQLGV